MGWRERFREDNELLLSLVSHRWVIRIYLIIAVMTAARQTMYRWEHCSGTLNCELSFLKAAIWGLIWPFYWLNWATGFVLLRPYG
jgi:hypothetical protein